MPISAKELSKIIGVSPATVSMVMNSKPGISQTTRDYVLEAATKYGYKGKLSHINEVTNSVVQLITYKKHGQIVTDTSFFSELTEGITQECINHNSLLHVSYLYEDADLKKQIAQIQDFECSGILLLATEMHEHDFGFLNNFSVPVVILDAYYDSLNYDCVVINNIQGAFQATNYLLNKGFSSIGYLHSNLAISNFDERADGFYKALRAYDIRSSSAIVHNISPTSQNGYTDMLEILSSGVTPAKAYFADNDIIALASIKAFKEFGYRIPEDISIVGFDNMALSDITTPPLTTMNVKKKEMGAFAVLRLLNRRDSPDLQSLKMAINTELIIRESVLEQKL